MNKLIIASLLTLTSSIALADSVIVTQTKTWKSVPITVDTEKHTYMTADAALVPTEGDYYFSYSGYRCLKDKNEAAGEKVEVFKAASEGGVDIYCYPE